VFISNQQKQDPLVDSKVAPHRFLCPCVASEVVEEPCHIVLECIVVHRLVFEAILADSQVVRRRIEYWWACAVWMIIGVAREKIATAG